MSKYYNPKKTRGLFDPESKEPFKISRSKIELFVNCPKCFYSEARLGIGRPGGFPFSLNNAVDLLLKKEFDIHRAEKSKHPLMTEYKIDALPFSHPDLDTWRNARQGISYLHPKTNFWVYGGVDDIWQNSKGQLHVVDYKATSKTSEVSLDEDWQMGYKRQVEIYQWLFRKNGFDVSDVAYFVYCNGNTDKKAFDKKIEFDIKVIPYSGNADWIEKTLLDMKKSLIDPKPAKCGSDCDYCAYIKETAKILA